MISGDTTWALPTLHDAPDSESAPVVVIVEDDADTQANLQDILELDGFQVETVATAAELRGRTNWENVAATLLDRRLPDGDALELIPYLKIVAPRSAIVVITGYADVDSAVTALRLGTADYILKPINAEALRASLRRIAEQRHADQALRVSRAQLRQERDFVDSLIETAPIWWHSWRGSGPSPDRPKVPTPPLPCLSRGRERRSPSSTGGLTC